LTDAAHVISDSITINPGKKTGLNDEEAVGRWLSRAQLVPVAQNVQEDIDSWRCRFSYF
jgi:hypothetical protein